MRRLAVLLVPVALLAAACGGEPEPAPAPTPLTTKQFVQQVWDGWTPTDQAATCKDYREAPERTVDNTFPISSGIPTEYVADLLKRECK